MNRPERHACWLLRAWPVPDRMARGEEIIGTTLDLVPAGRRWLPLPVTLSLLSGGLRSRWHHHPPLWRWYLYAMLDLPLPWQWSVWVHNDLTGRGWRRRIAVRRAALWLASYGGISSLLWPKTFLVPPQLLDLAVWAALFGVWAALFGVAGSVVYGFAPMIKKRMFTAQGLDETGSFGPPSQWAWQGRGGWIPNGSLPGSLIALGLGLAVPTFLIPGPRSKLFPHPAPAGTLVAAGVWGCLTLGLGVLQLERRVRTLRARPAEAWSLNSKLTHRFPWAWRILPLLESITAGAVIHFVLFGLFLNWDVALGSELGASVGGAAVLLGFIAAAMPRRLGRPIRIWDACPSLGRRWVWRRYAEPPTGIVGIGT